MKVNLSVKDFQETVKYNRFASFLIIDKEEKINFTIENLYQEVKTLPKKKKRQYRKIILSFLGTATSFLMLSSKSMANNLPPSIPQNTPGTVLPTGAVGIPNELLEGLVSLLSLTTAVAVILCIGMLIAAGVMRALRNKKEASDWTVDIIKGLAQVLIAAPLVFLIYFLATVLFAGTGWFISPFNL